MEGPRLHVWTGFFVAAAGTILWFLATWNGPWNVQRDVGTVLAVLGIAFVAVARYQLGKAFSVRAEAHHLVTTGLYSKIRNPIYVFGMVMITGMILVLQRPEGWLVFVAGVIAQTIRARRESRVLEAAFGDAYREYRSKTWF
jgi:protein-S-isoprenylcysteine O-methyltransferase Ste14